ncbi:MAG: hypothetical protein A2351_05570 [Omnitrophica bacterium RIFOXYB12_FULL_50_7]|nr:MAG: hypothetical protein A2351_05570 [Omnitrophica bacterium RIFOXYB12_FULL_50_7]
MKLEELKLHVAEGEGLTVEFKEKFTSRIDRDIVALANARGGFIFLGVNDEGQMVGEKLTNRMKADILSLARNCEPHIAISKVSQVDKTVVIEIPEGDEKPHSCSSGYFRRLDAVTQKMTQKEVGLLFKNVSAISYEERICGDISWNDVSKEKIETFLKEAGIAIDKIDPKDVLTSLNLATKKGIKNAGVLFFARELRRYIAQCETILVSFKGTQRVDIIDRKDVQDDLWTQYQEAMIFLKRHLSVRTEIKGLDRKDSYEIPLEALREAVANALIHRDYSVRGTSIMVEVHENHVIIKNPGGFPSGMSQDRLGALSVRRNELIADIFARMHRSERVGSGFKRIRESMEAAGLPFPKISSDEFFFIEFERPAKGKDTELGVSEGVSEGVNEGVSEGVNEGVNLMIKYIKQNPGKRAPYIAGAVNVPLKTLERWLKKVKSEGKIRYKGSAKTGGYYAV